MISRSEKRRSILVRVSRRRRAIAGTSLIEVMATITVMTLVTTACVSAIRMLFVLERRAAVAVDEQNARWRMFHRWNTDVQHATEAALLGSLDAADSSQIRLAFSDGVEVEYRAEESRILRVSKSAGKTRTESFRMGSQWWCRFRITGRQCEAYLGKLPPGRTAGGRPATIDPDSATFRIAARLEEKNAGVGPRNQTEGAGT